VSLNAHFKVNSKV